jgi:hypothetical protein
VDELKVSLGAQMLIFDLGNDCAAQRHSGGVPCIVMPRLGDPKPRTSGQIADVFVQELLNNGLIEEKANGACALTPSGREYYEKRLKNRN